MTRSQYKNIIQYTLFFNKELEKGTSLDTVKKILNNLGVSCPNGDIKEIANVLKRKDYMGWRPISCEDVQFYADLGVPTMAIIDLNRIVIICPDAKIDNLSDVVELDGIKNDNVKCFNELDANNLSKMIFFTYNYGRELHREKDK